MVSIFGSVLPIVVCIALTLVSADQYCPSLCVCKSSRTTDVTNSNVDNIESIKLKCGSPETVITELKEIDLSKIASLVVNLNLSENSITTLSREFYLPQLQKLDLSHNKITLIEPDAFSNLTNLLRLDLSSNSIQSLYMEVFNGLGKLERLLLNQNQIATMADNTFHQLYNLKQIDLSANPLVCDCGLLWIAEWSRSASVRLTGNPRCARPPPLLGQSVKKIRSLLDLAQCGRPTTLVNALLLRPENGQVVFQGDSLTLRCKAPFSTIKMIYNLTWSLPNTTVDTEHFRIANLDPLEEGQAETILTITEITNNHTGTYTCTYTKDNATDLSEEIDIVVISNVTKYCPIQESVDNKGMYTWPSSITGNLVSQPCHNKDGAWAYQKCGLDGVWVRLNTSACPYESETTKMLEQFALVNLSVYKDSVVTACERLHSLVLQNAPPTGTLTDPDDVNFIAKAVNNYMMYAASESDLGSALLDIVNTVMNLPTAVMRTAESLYGACSSLIAAVENISQYTGNIQGGHKANFAVERFSIKRESFAGIGCFWYSEPSKSGGSEGKSKRTLHCSTTNTTIASLLGARDKVLEAGIQIPATLLYRLDHQYVPTLGAGNVHRNYGLIVSMYGNAALFPRVPSAGGPNQSEHVYRGRVWDFYGSKIPNSGGLAITTPVVGIKIVNVSLVQSLADPVYIMVRNSEVSSGVSGRAVLWDEETHMWSDSPNGCSVHRVVSNLVVIQCYKLGYVGLLQNVETGIYGGRSGGARFKFSHPAIYVGSIILLVCLMVAILTYTVCYSAIHMAPRVKHALINCWLSFSLLCFMYTLGIYQTEDMKLCQAIGLLLHYLTLSSLLWITVAVSQLYKYLSKKQPSTSTLQTPEDELPPDVPIQKPILGIYLVGWGIALIVCGISGAVNMRDYASYSQCFLSNAPALSAVFVPAGIIIIFLCILFLLIRCTIRNVNGQLSEGTQATENVDLEMWEPSLLVNNTADRQSERSATETEVEDTEHTPVVQLRAHVIVLCVYLGVWSCGTIAIYHPFPLYLPYQEDIFSILYALSATVLGTFILFFYGIARSDVRSQWLLMHCYLKKRKPCCRARTVFDTNAQNVPQNQHNLAPISNLAAAQARSRSSSQNSRSNSKSNNSNMLKAATELNGQTLHDTLPNGNNMNLVVMHRQQYRSNNSVTTYPEIGPDGAEIFYNANQSNVARKFFKKQRKHIRRNCLDIPRRRNYDSDSQISGSHLPSVENRDGVSSLFTSGSKVNNTNIHIERGQQSDNGMKEMTRHQLNPNILAEVDESPEKPQLKRFVLEKDIHQNSRLKLNEVKPSNQPPLLMNIYTNVPETKVPQHQVATSSATSKGMPLNQDKHLGQCSSSSMSAECLDSMPAMRTVSQQCSLEYSSTSEVATPLNQLGSDKTLNTHSELTSLQEIHSALCSTHEITSDTEEAHSFEKYTDFTKSKKGVENSKQHLSCGKLQNEYNKKKPKVDSKSLNRSLQDINTRRKGSPKSDSDFQDALPTPCTDDQYFVNDNANASESDNLVITKGNNHQSDRLQGDFETQSLNAGAGEQPYENESDIYFPNYQMSEVSIRSHGLYAPPPASICANDLNLTFSNGELSRTQNDDDCYENQYVNYNPAWRKVNEGLQSSNSRFYHSPAVSCPDVNRADNDSPASLVSEIDELYKQITSRDRRTSRRTQHSHNVRSHGDAALRHCESDSCISESHSDILDSDQRAETRV